MAVCEARMPLSSSAVRRSIATMSYQARMAYPPLSVTGRTGACGKTKRSAALARAHQLRHDRLEVMAVGAQPVQPDHGGLRVAAGFDLDCITRHARLHGSGFHGDAC